MRKLVQRLTPLMCVLLAFSACVHAQRSQRIRVPQDKPTIQAAINSARVGDTVLVDEGLYYENIRISKNVVVASRFILDGDPSHVSRTIIDGSRPRDPHKASVVAIQGSTDTTCEGSFCCFC